jgi:hypothetical protein
VDLMRSIAREGYETLTPAECSEVVDFIEQNWDDRAISLRLLEPSFRKVVYARSEGLDWRPLVLTPIRRWRRTLAPWVNSRRSGVELRASREHPSSVCSQSIARDDTSD